MSAATDYRLERGKPPRAIPEIIEEIAGIKDLLYGKGHVVDPAIRLRLGQRRKECKNELIEAERRLAAGE